MRTIERGAKKKRQRRNLRNAMLLTIGATGMLGIAAIAPNIFQLLGKTGSLARLKYHSKTVLARLRQKGEIEFVEMGGKHYVRLTPRGEDALALAEQRTALTSTKPRKWDRRYRLVIFDIPEKRKTVREQLRRQMHQVGFLRIQDSAWLYPYDCEEFIALLKADLHIGKAVLYAVVEEIENDKWIRAHFHLPSA